MPDFSMFGPQESGTRVYDQDQLNNFIKQVQGQHLLSTIGLEQARARKLDADARSAAEIASIAKGRDVTAPLSDQFSEMANLALNRGLVTQGTKLAEESAKLKSHEAQDSAATALAGKRAATAASEGLKVFASAMNGVKSQEDFDNANAMYALTFGQPSPFSGATYSPDLVKRIGDMALTKKQQLDLQMKKAEDEDEARTRASLRGYRAERLKILDRQEQERERHAKEMERIAGVRAEKAGKGGKEPAVGSPSAQTVKRAGVLIGKEFPDLPANELAEARQTVAARAKALMTANRALDEDTALRQALREEHDSFKTIEEPYRVLGVKVPGAKPDKKTSFDATALPSDRKALVKGRTYQTAKGLGRWTGEGFELLQQSGNNQSKSPPAASDGNDAEDDEDGDE